MIKSLLILIPCLAIIQVQAQIRSVNVKTTGTFIDETLRIISSPQLEIQKSNHLWSLGPAILMATEKAVSEKKFPKLVGLQGTYKTYPLGGTKRVNFFLFDDLLLQRIVDTWSSTVWDDTQESYVAYTYSSAEFILQNNVGYGIELTVAKRFILKNSIGIGFYYSYTKGKSETDAAPYLPFMDDNINGYDPFGFSWLINVGIGYQFR
jgi:hypothetical protein